MRQLADLPRPATSTRYSLLKKARGEFDAEELSPTFLPRFVLRREHIDLVQPSCAKARIDKSLVKEPRATSSHAERRSGSRAWETRIADIANARINVHDSVFMKAQGVYEITREDEVLTKFRLHSERPLLNIRIPQEWIVDPTEASKFEIGWREACRWCWQWVDAKSKPYQLTDAN